MDSKKTRFNAATSAVVVAKFRITRKALCGRYVAFATRDVLHGLRVSELSASIGRGPMETAAPPVGLSAGRLRQR